MTQEKKAKQPFNNNLLRLKDDYKTAVIAYDDDIDYTA
jgi:hypothetical protein